MGPVKSAPVAYAHRGLSQRSDGRTAGGPSVPPQSRAGAFGIRVGGSDGVLEGETGPLPGQRGRGPAVDPGWVDPGARNVRGFSACGPDDDREPSAEPGRSDCEEISLCTLGRRGIKPSPAGTFCERRTGAGHGGINFVGLEVFLCLLRPERCVGQRVAAVSRTDGGRPERDDSPLPGHRPSAIVVHVSGIGHAVNRRRAAPPRAGHNGVGRRSIRRSSGTVAEHFIDCGEGGAAEGIVWQSPPRFLLNSPTPLGMLPPHEKSKFL